MDVECSRKWEPALEVLFVVEHGLRAPVDSTDKDEDKDEDGLG